jgi:hypothetical protein
MSTSQDDRELAFEQRMRADLAFESRPAPDDDERIAGLVTVALATGVGAGATVAAVSLVGRSTTRLWLLVTLGLGLGGVGAAIMLAQPTNTEIPAPREPVEPQPAAIAPPPPRVTDVVPPPAVVAAAPVTSTPVDSVSSARPKREAKSAAPTAAELLRRANDARREHRDDDALADYRRLRDQYADAREEIVSRVAMGRLLLERKRDAKGALAAFDRYLASSPDGSLAEEAMVGRASALKLLGRTAEERAAWTALLERFPDTLHRERATARLAELPKP